MRTYRCSDWDLGNLQVKTTPWTRCCVPETTPEQLLQWDGEHHAAKRPLPSGNTVTMKGVCGLRQCCTDSRFPRRTLLKSSHCLHRLTVVHPATNSSPGKRCTCSHHPHDVKESMIHQTRLLLLLPSGADLTLNCLLSELMAVDKLHHDPSAATSSKLHCYECSCPSESTFRFL